MARKIQQGLLSAADAADLNARLERLERLAVVPGQGGKGIQGAGGTIITPYQPRREIWAMLTDAGQFVYASHGSSAGRPGGCAIAYSWEEWWDGENGCMVKRGDGLQGSIHPEDRPGQLFPAFDVNGAFVDVPVIVRLREGRNSPFWYFDRLGEQPFGSGSGAGIRGVPVSDLIQCTPNGASVPNVCLEVIGGRLVRTDCHGHPVGGGSNPGVDPVCPGVVNWFGPGWYSVSIGGHAACTGTEQGGGDCCKRFESCAEAQSHIAGGHSICAFLGGGTLPSEECPVC